MWRGVLTVFLLSATWASAQDKARKPEKIFVSYSVDMKKSAVSGAMMIARIVKGEEVAEGYSLKRVAEFIAEDCASGKVINLKLGRKHYSKGRNFVRQLFSAKCLGGPHPSIGASREAEVTIVRQDDGRDLAQYTFFVDGYIKTSERYR